MFPPLELALRRQGTLDIDDSDAAIGIDLDATHVNAAGTGSHDNSFDVRFGGIAWPPTRIWRRPVAYRRNM